MSSVNPKTKYSYHLKKAAEPILLITLVSSLALNLAILNTQQESERKLHEDRIRLLESLNQESIQALLVTRNKKSSLSSSSYNLSNLPSPQFYKRELLLAKRLQHLSIHPDSVSIHPRIIEQLEREDGFHKAYPPKSVPWSQALFGNPGQAKSGMRKAVAGIRESMTRGIKRTEESVQSEIEAKAREKSESDSREDWTDEDWEAAFLKAAGESSETFSDQSPSITSLLRSDFGSQSSNNTTARPSRSSSSLFPTSSSSTKDFVSSSSYQDIYTDLESTPISSFDSYEPDFESGPAKETPRTKPSPPPPSSFSRQWSQNQGTRRYF